MRLPNRFKTRDSLELFYRLLATSLALRAVTDATSGAWRVYAGEYFPWRHLWAAIPLLPPAGAALLWVLLAVCALAIFLDRHRSLAVRAAAVLMAVSLTQIFQNQQLLAFIVLAFAAIAPPTPAEPGSPVVRLLRYQLFIVYVFSALHKILAGFYDSATLSNTLTQVLAMPAGPWAPRALVEWCAQPSVARVLSVGAIGAELGLPVLLTRAPRAGFWGVCALHAGFAFLMPGIWPFTLLMMALAALFLRNSRHPAPVSP